MSTLGSDEFDPQLLEDLYMWIDDVPLTRPKRDLKRDFADGVMVAELIKYFFPHLVDLHNYPPALSAKKKIVNWDVLNRRVFMKLGFEVSTDVIKNIVDSKPLAIEQLLLLLRKKIEHLLHNDKVEADQDNYTKSSPSNMPHRRGQEEEENAQVKKKPDIESVNNKTLPPVDQPVQKSIPQRNNKNILDTNKTRPTISQPNVKPAFNHEKPPISQPPQIAFGRTNQPPVKTNQESVSLSQLLEDKEHELINKEEVIDILQAKVRRLENLLQLKELRIDDLQQQLNSLKPKKRAALTS